MQRAQIIIKDLTLFGYHGVYPRERERGTQFKITLIADLSPDLRGFDTDDIADAVNYETIAERVQTCVAKERYRLIERLCKAIAASVLALPGIEAVDVTAEKRVEGLTPQPQWFGVRIALSRSDLQ